MSMITKVFVGSLPAGTRPEELRHMFENYGIVVSCDVMNRCGFVHMETPAQANTAIMALNRTEYKGHMIVVELGRSSTGSNRGGGSHGAIQGRGNKTSESSYSSIRGNNQMGYRNGNGPIRNDNFRPSRLNPYKDSDNNSRNLRNNHRGNTDRRGRHDRNYGSSNNSNFPHNFGNLINEHSQDERQMQSQRFRQNRARNSSNEDSVSGNGSSVSNRHPNRFNFGFNREDSNIRGFNNFGGGSQHEQQSQGINNYLLSDYSNEFPPLGTRGGRWYNGN